MTCVETAIRTFEECPICRDKIYNVEDLSRNIYLSNEIDNLQVFCQPRQDNLSVDICHWSGALEHKEAHSNVCTYRNLIKCPVAAGYCLESCTGMYPSHETLRDHIVEYSVTKESRILDQFAELRLRRLRARRLCGFGYSIVPSPIGSDMMIEDHSDTIYCGAVNDEEQKHGLGINVVNDRISYIGRYADGKMQGLGYYENKDVYTHNGMFENDMRHGECFMFTTVLGRQGRGMFRNDVMHGQGTVWSTVDRFTYAGDFENGNMHGYGKLVFACGEKSFVGIFVENEINGAGVMTHLVSNETTEGTFVGELCHGKGEQKNRYGKTVYCGDFVRGRREGRGVCVTSDGAEYTGVFVNDMPHGTGKLKQLDGSIVNDASFKFGVLQLKTKEVVDLSDM